jgi:RNA polymerase sigma-70 factor (ECF subfamily)
MKKFEGVSDEELALLYVQGDNRAFDELLSRTKNKLFTYIMFVVRDHDIADDIFQETFIKAVKVIDEGGYTDSGKFLSWILRIAHNRVLDHFRREKSSRQINEKEAGYDVLGTLRFAENTIEDTIVHNELMETVRSLVEELPEDQREVVRLRYYSKLSFQEIAEHTDVSINTALGRMRYALINMRRIADENHIVLTM